MSNLLCLPTLVLYRSSTKSFFYGPPGVTIKRPELANTPEYEATINQKPYGASKGHEINVEWALEWNRAMPVRQITNFDKVKCIVLVEKEGKSLLICGLSFESVFILYFSIHLSCALTVHSRGK